MGAVVSAAAGAVHDLGRAHARGPLRLSGKLALRRPTPAQPTPHIAICVLAFDSRASAQQRAV
eukprot:751183-Rhodomonas_salina.2